MHLKQESKNARFKRLASHRTNEVLYRLKVLSNCSNKQLYEYDQREIDKIFSEIEKKVREAKSKFNSLKKSDRFYL